jgi:hypothetical protein
MSTRKNSVGGSLENRETRKFRIDQIDESIPRPLQNIEITSLKIEQDDDAGCDPYNSTGQFCVIDNER